MNKTYSTTDVIREREAQKARALAGAGFVSAPFSPARGEEAAPLHIDVGTVLEALARAVPVHPHCPPEVCKLFRAEITTLRTSNDGTLFSLTEREATFEALREIAGAVALCCVSFGRLPMLVAGPAGGSIPAGYRLVVGVRRYDKQLGYIVAAQKPTWIVELECQCSLEPVPEGGVS